MERGFADLGYALATQACDTRRTICDSTRDIIENNNAGVRSILDFLTQDKIATLTAVVQKQQKGILDISNDYSVRSFREKSMADNSMINAGYMVFQPEIFDYLKDDTTIFEQDTFQKLVVNNQLMTYVHKGFWQCMDTLREKQKLETLLETGKAPWKLWE
jgi:glucose-1-phosphate cytidylyltransferase